MGGEEESQIGDKKEVAMGEEDEKKKEENGQGARMDQ